MLKEISLEQLLEYAVRAGWNDLASPATLAQVRVEYHPGGDVPLEFVKIWASTVRGFSSLVCEYWPQPLWSRPVGLTFGNQYHSDHLVRAFAALTRNPAAFPRSAGHGFDGLFLVENITAEEHVQGKQQLSEALRVTEAAPVMARAHGGTYAA
jgi:hypothetical protein